jgi:hypothetical protein
MYADVDPDSAPQEVVWSVYVDPDLDPDVQATIDPNTGLLTVGSVSGNVTVIAKALDGSHVSGQVVIKIP